MIDSLEWLLEPDAANPGVRYFALTDLLGRSRSDPEVQAAQAAVMQSGPVPAILTAQQADGSWGKPIPGYAPKYRGTVWSVTFLAMLGADGRDPRVCAPAVRMCLSIAGRVHPISASASMASQAA